MDQLIHVDPPFWTSTENISLPASFLLLTNNEYLHISLNFYNFWIIIHKLKRHRHDLRSKFYILCFLCLNYLLVHFEWLKFEYSNLSYKQDTEVRNCLVIKIWVLYLFTNNEKYINGRFFDRITRAVQDKLITCVNI